MSDDTPQVPPISPRSQPAPQLTEAELSRIAREAVHQPADARLDKQLARMGLLEATEPALPSPAGTASGTVAIDPEIVRLRDDLRRLRALVSLLVAIIAVLAIVVVLLLVR